MTGWPDLVFLNIFSLSSFLRDSVLCLSSFLARIVASVSILALSSSWRFLSYISLRLLALFFLFLLPSSSSSCLAEPEPEGSPCCCLTILLYLFTYLAFL
uniref:Putative ovule protein n=1 Tax=Solanum chacoense TaxID=4108 RepID=A0A0V0HN20_SOLCH